MGTRDGVVLLPTVFRVPVNDILDEALVLRVMHLYGRYAHHAYNEIDTTDGDMKMHACGTPANPVAMSDLVVHRHGRGAVDQGLAVVRI